MYEVIRNPLQGTAPRVLFVCSAGILRSATAAHLFCSPDYGWNTRCAGIWKCALVKVSLDLVEWADVIFCMELEHRAHIEELLRDASGTVREKIVKKVYVLNIPDTFTYRSPSLEKLLLDTLKAKNLLDLSKP